MLLSETLAKFSLCLICVLKKGKGGKFSNSGHPLRIHASCIVSNETNCQEVGCPLILGLASLDSHSHCDPWPQSKHSLLENGRSRESPQRNVICSWVSEGGMQRWEAKGRSEVHWNTRKRLCVRGTTCCFITKISLEENQPNLFPHLSRQEGISWVCSPKVAKKHRRSPRNTEAHLARTWTKTHYNNKKW